MRRSRTLALTLSLGLLALGAVAAGHEAGDATTTACLEQPDLIVARFHADWCGACKTLAPKFDSLQRAAGDESVLFVTFDLTGDESRRQAALLAGALCLDKAWAASGMKTGQALIVGGRAGEVITTVTADEDPATSLEKLEDALAAVTKR